MVGTKCQIKLKSCFKLLASTKTNTSKVNWTPQQLFNVHVPCLHTSVDFEHANDSQTCRLEAKFWFEIKLNPVNWINSEETTFDVTHWFIRTNSFLTLTGDVCVKKIEFPCHLPLLHIIVLLLSRFLHFFAAANSFWTLRKIAFFSRFMSFFFLFGGFVISPSFFAFFVRFLFGGFVIFPS